MIETIFLYALAIFFLFLCILFGWTTFNLLWSKAPFIRSPQKRIQKMMQLAQIQKGETVYDLGCGLGDVLFAIEEKKGKAIGYEIVWPVYIIARIRKYFKKSQADIRLKNFFKADLSDANVIFCYLVPSIMKRFNTEIWPKITPGTKVISHAFHLPNQKPQKEITDKNVKIYYYQKS